MSDYQPIEAVGIGDLHLDSPISQWVPDYNQRVVEDVRLAIQEQLRTGISHVFLLGDVFNKPIPNYAANGYNLLIELFAEFSSLEFVVIEGNHDRDYNSDSGTSSLNLLRDMALAGILQNVQVVTNEPRKIEYANFPPVYGMPYPHNQPDPECLNLAHCEYKGATQDNGKPTRSEEEPPVRAMTVVGHLHTPHKVGFAWYSGTLQQKSFGEQKEKSYLRIRWTGDLKTSKIKAVPFAPSYVLHNVVINTLEEFEQMREDVRAAPEHHYYKVFVNATEVLLPANAFSDLVQVVKYNPFRTSQELTSLIEGDLALDSKEAVSVGDVRDLLTDWMRSHTVDESLSDRSTALFNRIYEEEVAEK